MRQPSSWLHAFNTSQGKPRPATIELHNLVKSTCAAPKEAIQADEAHSLFGMVTALELDFQCSITCMVVRLPPRIGRATLSVRPSSVHSNGNGRAILQHENKVGLAGSVCVQKTNAQAFGAAICASFRRRATARRSASSSVSSVSLFQRSRQKISQKPFVDRWLHLSGNLLSIRPSSCRNKVRALHL